ncbi:MAG: hypothetical protein HYV07_11970 [Deltaproteobacteria bacterium]|nr:hypothetical protein [Deltaproteobacteria bacterium]
MVFETKRGLLSSLGFEVVFRTHTWTDCLISAGGEAHSGHGHTQEEALEDALRRALPTELSRRLFARGTVAPPDPHPEPKLAAIADPERIAGQIAVIVSRPANAPPLPTEPIVARGFRVGAPVESEPPPAMAPAALDPPELPRPPAAKDPVPTEAPVDRAPRSVEDSLLDLDVLSERIRENREELGLSSPERQRMVILAWISEARSHADAFPDDLRIRDRVGAISRSLTEIGKTFWPGSVTALQLHMQPRDLPRHLLGGVATTWHRAAELAELALRNRELEDERRGFDAYGWADGSKLFPQAKDPERLLESIIAEVEAFSGPLEVQAGPFDTLVRPDPTQFQRWIRCSRWLRGADASPDRWARLVGRLRWWAFRRDPALNPVARELEPSYSPSVAWASLLGFDAEKQTRDRELREMLTNPPPAGATPEQLREYLERVLRFTDTHHGNVVAALEANALQVIELGEQAFAEDSKLAKRWRAVADALIAGTAPAVSPLPSESPQVELASGPKETLPDATLDVIRRRTEGKRAVLVTSRRDPELHAKLQDAFRFSTLDTRIPEARRIETLAGAIQGGSYDLVLAAIGFQNRDTDAALARACHDASVRYVRVNRARPIVCLRALVRAG